MTTVPIAPLTPDDPRLTALALGELDEPERSAVAALINADPELTKLLGELQATANLLSAHLREETEPGLSIDQRLDIERELRTPRPHVIRWRRAAVALAAGLLLAVGGFGLGRATGLRRHADEALARLDAAVPESAPPPASRPRGVEPFGLGFQEPADAPAPGAQAPVELIEEGQLNAKREVLARRVDSLDARTPDVDFDQAPLQAQPARDAKLGGFSGSAASLALPGAAEAAPALRSMGDAEAPPPAEPAGASAATSMFSETRELASAPANLPASMAGSGGGMTESLAAMSAPAQAGAAALPDPNDVYAAAGESKRGFQYAARGGKPAAATVDELADLKKNLSDMRRSPDGSKLKQRGLSVPALKQESELAEGEELARPELNQTVASPDNRLYALLEKGREVKVVDRASGNQLLAFSSDGGELDKLSISPDNRFLVAAGADRSVNVWNLQNGQVVQSFRVQEGPAPDVRFGERGELILNNAADEAYNPLVENPFLPVLDQPLSTFAVDVDTASYTNVRRFLNEGALPPPDAVRIEEMINYFSYDDPPPPVDGEPFSLGVEVARAPWTADHRLVRVGLKARELHAKERPASNLVFLLDVSGSMDEPNKLPLVKDAMHLLVGKLGPRDRVALVTYANDVAVPLDSTPCDQKPTILAAIDALAADGGTNGGAGLDRAYEIATKNLIAGATNRVLLCTDGDFNVGETDRERLTRMVEERAKAGIDLTVLGFGTGNLKEATLEQLANRSNGQYHYIDSGAEARRTIVDHLGGALVTVARDVKVQVEFNPAQVASYRLIGYENRMLQASDFRDDLIDAGEIGAGHTVTALYEVTPAAAPEPGPQPTKLKYQQPAQVVQDDALQREFVTVAVRWKAADAKPEDAAAERSIAVVDDGKDYSAATTDLRFAAAVAEFGMLLRGSAHKGTATFGSAVELGEAAIGEDPSGLRREFVTLVRKAGELAAAANPPQ